MKYLFYLFTIASLVLVLGVAGAQEELQEVTGLRKVKGYGNYESDQTRAMLAANRVRFQQSFALVGQAKLALKKNEIKKAEVFLKQALSFEPDNDEACLRLAEIHIRSKQPSAVVADLEPIVNPRDGATDSVGSDISVRMLYALAQLDCGNWGAAAACYQKSFRIGEEWHLPGGRPRHTFPNVQFSPDNPDVLGLRAQAYLIRGGYSPEFVEEQDKPPYMLENLRQALKYNPKSMDANYLSGFMLAKMERFAEARAAYEKAMRLASKEARPEVKQALDALKVQEDTKRENEARVKANRQSNPN
jgi:tetratricopeptide (TPR) repeat protein